MSTVELILNFDGVNTAPEQPLVNFTVKTSVAEDPFVYGAVAVSFKLMV